MARLSHICVALASAFVLLVAAASVAEDEYVLSISQDNYKVVFISGNLTAAATYSWPRVIFYHSYMSLSPFFEVGFPHMYLFNDTNSDGRFEDNETLHVGYLDDYHTAWSIVEPVVGTDPAVGQYAEFGMRSTVSLYRDPTNMTALVNDWSNVTFWFRVVENGEFFMNSAGYFVVQGKIEMRMNVTLEVLNGTKCSGIVMEQLLKGGGSTEMFLLRELIAPGQENLTMISSRVDETVDGLNVTHHLRETSQPRQEARFAKEDWTTQAFYFWNSDVNLTKADETQRWMSVNSTYFTTGTGLVLYSAYPCSNETTILSTDMSLGLHEAGFGISARDWLEDNMVALLVTAALLTTVIVFSASVVRWRRRRTIERAMSPIEEQPDEEKGP